MIGRGASILATAIMTALLSAIPAAADSFLDRPVRVQGGLLQGTSSTPPVHIFKGIPYAAPPVGDLRWKEPQPPEAWGGIRQANNFGNVCMQSKEPATPEGQPRSVESIYGAPESEDCLYLNIWTPAQSTEQRLPVMVWIYGGGYTTGGSSRPEFDGGAFARDGIVFVSFNYRGGALGYLVHPELTKESPHHTSGNYGNLDQIAALRWVQKNIAAFGGDPANVTIFGELAGSGSVNMLHASPLAKGLFRRAIGESTTQLDFTYCGSCGKSDRSFASAEKDGLEFQEELHAKSLQDLRKMSAGAISSSTFRFYPIQGDGYFLPSTVYSIFAAGRQNDVALIAGSNANEGENLRGRRIFPQTPQEQADYARLYGKQNADGDTQSIADALSWQAQRWAALQHRTGHEVSYVYFFLRAQPFESYDDWGFPLVGAFHTAEIPYVFDNLGKIDGPWTPIDQKVAHTMHAYWVNFATSGNPNGPGLPEWPAYDPGSRRVIVLDDIPHADDAPRRESREFLDSYYRRVLEGR